MDRRVSDPYQYDEFEIRAQMPDTEGETIYFPVVQTCEEGEHAWIQIPEEGGPEAESPTPGVTLVASTRSDDHGSSETEETVPADESADAEAPADETSPEGSNVLSWAGLILGGLGAVLGGAAFATSRRKE